MNRKRNELYLLVMGGLLAGCQDSPPHEAETAQAVSEICEEPEGVGLGLYFLNGEWNQSLSPFPDPERPSALHLVDGSPRFIEEIYLKSSLPTTLEDGLEPVTNSGDFSGLNWNDVEQVEEGWRLEASGTTWQHQRFFRNADWMNPKGKIKLTFRKANGHAAETTKVQTGRDDDWRGSDDFFIRRFVARTVSTNCVAENDCSNADAIHLAEAFVQLRVNLHPDDTSEIPSNATALDLEWSEAPGHVWQVPIIHDAEPADGTGYGFNIDLSLVDPPMRGYYLPGEVVTVRMHYMDGSGIPLFPTGALPSYAEMQHWRPQAKGLRYLTFDGNSMLYWAHKATQGAMQTFLAGPIHKMNSAGTTPITPASLFMEEIPAATRAVDGWTSLIQETPRTPTMFSCLLGFFPPACDFPTSTDFTYTLPEDAETGTWQTGVKARRYWAGEPSMRAASLAIQVGSPTVTTFPGHPVNSVGTCWSCHTDETAIQRVGHGFPVFGVSPACMACHTNGYYFEPDAGIDVRLEYLHDQSRRLSAP
ncbi:cytochrome c3 family protein [Patescibacteria group bacterium]|nr:cytochrome c3 family protein [Patescibacteria group bacterium]